MSKIASHAIGTVQGTRSLLDWVAEGNARYYPTFDEHDQLKFALKIASIKDSDLRELSLTLLNTASRLAGRISDARREFKTLHDALTRIDKDIDNDAAWKIKHEQNRAS